MLADEGQVVVICDGAGLHGGLCSRMQKAIGGCEGRGGKRPDCGALVLIYLAQSPHMPSPAKASDRTVKPFYYP